MSRTTALLLTFALATTVSAQSFDCKLAHTPREKAVCADTRLSALDAEIAANYKTLRAQLSPQSAALVQSDQATWLHWIDLVCPAHGKGSAANQTQCLQNQYFTRAHDFGKTAHLGSTLIFPRANFLFKAGATPTGPISSIDPGFGYGTLRWPQIDKPTPAQAAFNNAVKNRAARLAVGIGPDQKNPTFSTSVDPSGTIDAYFTIEAANGRLLDITFTDGTYGWGAAHPNTASTSFLWWLDRSRELAAADVFSPASGWQQKLVPLTIARLNANSEIKNMLWKGDQLQKAVQQSIAAAPSNWTVTRDGLTITFGQYTVGPYFLGMPQAHLTWSQLTPYLVPTLQPATLPTPLPKTNP